MRHLAVKYGTQTTIFAAKQLQILSAFQLFLVPAIMNVNMVNIDPDSNQSRDNILEPCDLDHGPPIVFQCAKCSSIISDSFVFTARNAEMHTLSFSGKQ